MVLAYDVILISMRTVVFRAISMELGMLASILLRAIYYSLTTCYVLLTTGYVLLTTHYFPLATCYMLLTTYYLLLVTDYLLRATCDLLCTAYYIPLTTDCFLSTANYSLLTPHSLSSRLTPYSLLLTPYSSRPTAVCCLLTADC